MINTWENPPDPEDQEPEQLRAFEITTHDEAYTYYNWGEIKERAFHTKQEIDPRHAHLMRQTIPEINHLIRREGEDKMDVSTPWSTLTHSL